MPAAEIRTDHHILAPPEVVWEVLTDFEAHAEWDPFLASLDGELVEGGRLRVRFRQPGVTMRPRITRLEPGRVLEWRGSLGIRGLFDGRHRFELVPDGAGTTLIHSETFTGLLVPLTGRMLDQTRDGFEAFNRAIAERVATVGV